MIRVQLACLDDREFAVTGALVPADKTFYLAFGEDPDRMQIVQVDLAAANAGKFLLDVGSWAGYGHPVGEIDAPGGLHKNDGNYRRPASKMGSQENSQYNRQMRAWADKTGFICAKGRNAGKPGYHVNVSGAGYYYSSELRQAYAAYLAGIAGAVA
jgi:hypothetical protein